MARLHPGRVLREEDVEPLWLGSVGLARALDVQPRCIAALIAGDTVITSDPALRLARCFRTSPQFWLSLQTVYDLAMAHAEHGAEIKARVQSLVA